MFKGSRNHLYTGKAGKLAAMSEFLLCDYNVAMPMVDEGSDVLLLRDQDGETRRAQVKTARCESGPDRVLFGIGR